MPCDINRTQHILLLQCGYCQNGVVAKYRGHEIMNWVQTNGQATPPHLVEVCPKAEPPSAPKYLPDNIRRFFLQGLDSLRRKGYDAAGTMFRKSLDVALKRIHPEGRGTLQRRIDTLPQEFGITSAMKEWAHEIRNLGNDAAHEEEPFTEAEAKALHAFTDMFLTYAFTLPGMLKERKMADPPV
ncbi:MAG TPA: DUF4145 domain-containing protein [Acetobacteraceae bacterium]|nr:DUF4145 domain-containing protein [Acetobacteraceae bacterium]